MITVTSRKTLNKKLLIFVNIPPPPLLIAYYLAIGSWRGARGVHPAVRPYSPLLPPHPIPPNVLSLKAGKEKADDNPIPLLVLPLSALPNFQFSHLALVHCFSLLSCVFTPSFFRLGFLLTFPPLVSSRHLTHPSPLQHPLPPTGYYL